MKYLAILIALIPSTVLASPILSEVQLDGPNSEEFVEIFSDEKTELSGESWQKKANLSGWIGPGSRYLVSTESNSLSSGLSNTAGHIRLFNGQEAVDILSWGETDMGGVDVPAKGQSLKRMFNEDGIFLANWVISDDPSPIHQPYTPEECQPISSQSKTSYPKLLINEIYPDPKAPQTDAEHEFIEIYNPNNSKVSLFGYSLKSGPELNYNYDLPNLTIGPKKYLAIYSKDSGLSLSNSGSQVGIFSPLKQLDLIAYPSAPEGQSYAKLGKSWQWTSLITPNTKNRIVKITSNTPAEEYTPEAVQGERSEYSQPENSKLSNSTLVGMGAAVILYAGYEYRQDIADKFRKLSRYFRFRRKDRPMP